MIIARKSRKYRGRKSIREAAPLRPALRKGVDEGGLEGHEGSFPLEQEGGLSWWLKGHLLCWEEVNKPNTSTIQSV